MKKRVLIVEDDAALSRVLHDNLTLEGFAVESVADGNHALDAARAFGPDLILLDVTLPGRDGFELCEAWREGRGIPVIMLTARSMRDDKLRGLALGADDYITKPFDIEELLARVRVVLRRADPGPKQLRLGAVTIDLVARRSSKDNEPLELTYREYELLRYLAERTDRLARRDELLRNVWGYAATPLNSRIVDHAISRLRRKIEPDPHHPQFIHTVHGDGYFLSTEAGVTERPRS